MENIFRHESNPGKGIGWEVIINRSGKFHRRYFSDWRHGGRDGALAAAEACRDELLSRLPSRLPVKTRNRLNSSGVIGISVHTRKRESWEETCVIAQWPGGRVQFSVKKFGFEEAWRRAVAAREQALAALGIDEKLPKLSASDRKRKGGRNKGKRQR